MRFPSQTFWLTFLKICPRRLRTGLWRPASTQCMWQRRGTPAPPPPSASLTTAAACFTTSRWRHLPAAPPLQRAARLEPQKMWQRQRQMVESPSIISLQQVGSTRAGMSSVALPCTIIAVGSALARTHRAEAARPSQSTRPSTSCAHCAAGSGGTITGFSAVLWAAAALALLLLVVWAVRRRRRRRRLWAVGKD